jgi:hypothetical protein
MPLGAPAAGMIALDAVSIGTVLMWNAQPLRPAVV